MGFRLLNWCIAILLSDAGWSVCLVMFLCSVCYSLACLFIQPFGAAIQRVVAVINCTAKLTAACKMAMGGANSMSNAASADTRFVLPQLHSVVDAQLQDVHMQGQLIALFTSDAQVIAQATAVLPLIAFAMVRQPPPALHTPTKAVYDHPDAGFLMYVLW